MTYGNLALSPASWRLRTGELADLDGRIDGQPPLREAAARVTRRFPSGSSWLCAKLSGGLSGGPASADAVLLDIGLARRGVLGKLRLLRFAQRRQEGGLYECPARLCDAQAAQGGRR